MELQKENIIRSQDKKPSTPKEFQCNYCTRSYTQSRYLTRHVSVVHLNVRPFSCENCKKAFASKHEMFRHLKKGCYAKTSENPLKVGEFGCLMCDKTSSSKDLLKNHHTAFHPKEPFSFKKLTPLSQINTLFTCKGCFRSFYSSRGLAQHITYCTQTRTSCLKTKRQLELHVCSILCSKCDISFCSPDSLKLHFNSCEGPEIEILAEKLQITKIVDTFSCSKCDMDFDLIEALEKHSGNCEIAILQPGEEHFDHTYSKGVSSATSVKQGNLLEVLTTKLLKDRDFQFVYLCSLFSK